HAGSGASFQRPGAVATPLAAGDADTDAQQRASGTVHDLPVFGSRRDRRALAGAPWRRSEEHTSELQSPCNLVCRLLLEKKHKTTAQIRDSGLGAPLSIALSIDAFGQLLRPGQRLRCNLNRFRMKVLAIGFEVVGVRRHP